MATQIRDYPVYEPKKVESGSITNSRSNDFNLSLYSKVPTQILSTCSSVSESTSLGYAIEQVSDRLIRNYSLSLSRPTQNPIHTSPHLLRQRSKRREGVRIRKLIRVKSNKFENRSKGPFSENTRVGDINHIKNEHILNANFTLKYQPRVLADIAGHGITIMALSKAIEKKKIASLYLFHGPTGTGKTSMARIFAMALNCESDSSPKPCWSCRGCSRSLFIMELCSGNRENFFQKVKTLLESTSFSRAIPGFKVIIIKQSHLFNERDWDEFLGMAERAYVFGVVFVIVTIAANIVPSNILSRCQKFSFPKLIDSEITLKLAQIAKHEGVRIEKESLKMIAAKAEGSLREAENLLDQVALLGSSITNSMVQQFVGLLPQNKLLDLLEIAISGDAIKTMRYTKELLSTGVEPQLLVSQLASLISNILSDDAGSASSSSSKYHVLLRRVQQLANSQPENFSHALKVLVETEKQLKSSTDQNTLLMAALLDITSHDVSNRISTGDRSTVISEDLHNQGIFLSRTNSHSLSMSSNPEQLYTERNELFTSIGDTSNNRNSEIPEEAKSNLPNMSDIEYIWCKTLRGIQNGYVKEFLLQAKLASLTLSSGSIIVHLMFKRHEDKMAAQMSEITIKRVLQSTIGCDVTLNMSIEPAEMGTVESDIVLTRSQSYKHPEPQLEAQYLAEVFDTMSFEDAKHQSTQDFSPSVSQRATKFKGRTQSQDQNIYATEKSVTNSYPRNISPFLGLPMQKDEFDASLHSLRETLAKQRSSGMPRNSCLSISSIEQSDASVEPYSRDIFFDRVDEERRGNGSKNRRFRKGFLNYVESGNFPNEAVNQRSNYFWGCRDILCSKQTQ